MSTFLTSLIALIPKIPFSPFLNFRARGHLRRCFFSCLWGRHFAMLAFIPDLKKASRLFFWCLLRFGGRVIAQSKQARFRWHDANVRPWGPRAPWFHHATLPGYGMRTAPKLGYVAFLVYVGTPGFDVTACHSLQAISTHKSHKNIGLDTSSTAWYPTSLL